MQKILQLLIQLQDMEREIQALNEQKEQTPRRLALLKEKVQAAETHLDQQQEMLESIWKQRRQLEVEVEDLQQRAARSKQKLLEVKSNKEYQALLKEVDDIERLVREREDQIIEQMEAAERLQKEVQQQKRLLAETREQTERESARLEKEADKAEVLIENLRGRLDQLNPKIPADILNKYQFLKAHRKGIAIAPVRHGTCQVCHMNLPPQMFIDLQKDERMLYCPNCQRIMYWVGHQAYQRSPVPPGDKE